MTTYSLFGLVVDCELALDNARPGRGPADVTVRVLPAAAPPPLTGPRIAELRRDDEALSSLVAGDDGRAHLRVAGIADFVLDLPGGRVDCVPATGGDPAYLPILVTGLVLSCWLLLQGELVLHASAVDVDELGGAVALLGSSGMGKSTVAAVLAAHGRLVGDDVLRVDEVGDELVCRLGVTEARLRPKARSLAADGGLAGRDTVDGRLAVSLPLADADVPLRAVVIPGPSRTSTVVSLQRLSPVEAVVEVMRHPRVLGWTDPATTAAQFRRTADLARRVPVLRSVLPWGPPFSPTLGAELVAALREQLA